MYDLEISNIIHGFESIDFVGKTQISKKKDALYSRTCTSQLRLVRFFTQVQGFHISTLDSKENKNRSLPKEGTAFLGLVDRIY